MNHLFEFYWSDEIRKRHKLDELGNRIGTMSEPYDRARVLGVDMSMDELRGVLQHIVDEYRKRTP